MAKMWFVMVLLIAQNVYAIDKNEDINQSCDMCIASGKSWCLQKTKEGHCYRGSNDDACLDQEVINYTNNSPEEGDLLHPKALHETLTANQLIPTELRYDSSIQRNIAIIYDADLKDIINVTEGETKCNDQQCEVQIEAVASSEFCSRNLTSVEVTIKVENFSEIAKFTYDVACSCPCTKQKVHKSPRCNGHGTFRCGICLCYDEWHGDYCEEACNSRGDIEGVCMGENGEECSGNGKCVCNRCQCFKNMEGSQYYEQETCSDICTQTTEFHDCLRNNSAECQNGSGKKRLTVLPLNETTALYEKNESNRTVWILCQNYEDGCNLEYFVSRTEERYYAMIKKKCGIIAAGSLAPAGGSNVPLILGVLGLVAVVAAAGGFVLWKHMNALPQPSASPCYENIVPDDCQGINPIYQSPTTKFVNPTYGKC